MPELRSSNCRALLKAELHTHFPGGGHGLYGLPPPKQLGASGRGVSEAPFRVHGLMVADQHVQRPSSSLGLLLQPLQHVQDLELIVATIELVAHLKQGQPAETMAHQMPQGRLSAVGRTALLQGELACQRMRLLPDRLLFLRSKLSEIEAPAVQPLCRGAKLQT